MTACGNLYCSCCAKSYAAGFSSGFGAGYNKGYDDGFGSGYVSGYVTGIRGLDPLPEYQSRINSALTRSSAPLSLNCGCFEVCKCNVPASMRHIDKWWRTPGV